MRDEVFWVWVWGGGGAGTDEHQSVCNLLQCPRWLSDGWQCRLKQSKFWTTSFPLWFFPPLTLYLTASCSSRASTGYIMHSRGPALSKSPQQVYTFYSGCYKHLQQSRMWKCPLLCRHRPWNIELDMHDLPALTATICDPNMAARHSYLWLNWMHSSSS